MNFMFSQLNCIDDTACAVNYLQFDIILRIRNDIQCSMCQLPWTTVNVLGHIYVRYVTDPLAYHHTHCGDQRTTKVCKFLKTPGKH